MRADLPRPVLALVKKLLARDPDGRPRTALEALGAIEAIGTVSAASVG